MDQSDFDLEREEQLLQGARRALSPSPVDAQRVLAATRHALASPTGAATAAHAGSAVTQVAGALAIALVSAATGYYFGLHAQPAESAPVVAAPAVVSTPSVSPVSPVSPAPEPARTEEAPAPEPSPVAAGAASTSAVQDRTLARGATRRAGGAGAGQGATAQTVASAAPAATSSQAQEEITAMRRVERALREQQPQRALSLLFELDRNVPSGMLMQERQAAFAIARCAAGLGAAPQLAAEFASSYPNSPYIGRVRDACARHETSNGSASPRRLTN